MGERRLCVSLPPFLWSALAYSFSNHIFFTCVGILIRRTIRILRVNFIHALIAILEINKTLQYNYLIHHVYCMYQRNALILMTLTELSTNDIRSWSFFKRNTFLLTEPIMEINGLNWESCKLDRVKKFKDISSLGIKDCGYLIIAYF